MQLSTVRRSVKLSTDERRKLKAFVRKQPTRIEATYTLGLTNRGTLNNVLRAGSGSQKTIDLIREAIQKYDDKCNKARLQGVGFAAEGDT